MAEAATENKTPGGIAPFLIALLAIGSLIAFFAYRGTDIGQLGKLIGNLGSGPLFGEYGFLVSFCGSVISILIFLAWLGTGSFIYRLLRIEVRSVTLMVAVAIALGSAFWSLTWFLLGFSGEYYSSVAIATLLLGIGFLFAGSNSWGFRFLTELPLVAALVAVRWSPMFRNPENRRFWKLSGAEWSVIAMIGFVLAISLIGALAPPIAKDTLLYHFALPKIFAAQHGISFVEGNIASYIALGNEMHSVWAMLLGGIFDSRVAEAAAGATSFLFFPLLLLATYGGARELKIEGRWSLLAALMVASIPSAFYVASSSYIDLGLALYVSLAVFALSRWWREQEKNQLVLIAIFLGAALSIKLTALFVVAAFALIFLLRARNEKDNAGNVVLNGLAVLLLAGVIASPWYLRTWNATGSPVFPFYISIWKGEATGWDAERSNLFQAMNSQYGGANKGVADYVLSPLNISVKAQPEFTAYFDGVLGVSFLIGLPLLIWGLWKFELPVEVKIGSGVAGIMFLFWLFSSQQLRYLLPILPVLAIGIVAAGEEISKKIGSMRAILQLSFLGAAVAGILVSFAWFLQAAPLRVALGGESRDEYLTRNLDYYPYYQWLNSQTEPDAKVWLINMRRDTYDLDRPVFSDYLFEDWTLRKMVWDARSVPELKAKVAAMGVKYVLTRHDFLFDYDESTIVDDKKSRPENEAKLKMAKDLILDPANTIRSDDRFSLIKVF